MKFARLTRHLGLAVVAFVVVTACGSTSSGTATCSTAKTATSASACGGMDALVAAAKAEGKLNVIALPRDWANYGAILDGFTAKYGIAITSDNPDGSSQDEVNAVQQLGTTSRAPDVLDVGMAVALANLTLFAPYKVATWSDILDTQKESTGLWFQDYGGFFSVSVPAGTAPAIPAIHGPPTPNIKGKGAPHGNPEQANTPPPPATAATPPT